MSPKDDVPSEKYLKNPTLNAQNDPRKQFSCCKITFYPKVVVAGENWDAANEEAVKAGRKENTFLVHPFDQVRLETWSESKNWFLKRLLSRKPHGRATQPLWRR